MTSFFDYYDFIRLRIIHPTNILERMNLSLTFTQYDAYYIYHIIFVFRVRVCLTSRITEGG